MVKKYTSVIFLYLSMIIILGHNFIPHHHHEDSESCKTHIVLGNHCQDDNHREADGSVLKHLFSYFEHSCTDTTFISSSHTDVSFSKQLNQPLGFLKSLSLTLSDKIQNRQKAHIYNLYILRQLHSTSTSLRAPPPYID